MERGVHRRVTHGPPQKSLDGRLANQSVRVDNSSIGSATAIRVHLAQRSSQNPGRSSPPTQRPRTECPSWWPADRPRALARVGLVFFPFAPPVSHTSGQQASKPTPTSVKPATVKRRVPIASIDQREEGLGPGCATAMAWDLLNQPSQIWAITSMSHRWDGCAEGAMDDASYH